MKHLHFVHRGEIEREKRLLRFSFGGAEDLGKMEFDANPYDVDNLPEGAIGKDGDNMRDRVMAEYSEDKQEISGSHFKQMLSNGFRTVTNSIIAREKYSNERLRAGIEQARARGKFRQDTPDFSRFADTIEEELGAENFNKLMDEATMYVWRMPDFQKGLVKITEAMARAWKLVWEIMHDQDLLPVGHPIFFTDHYNKRKMAIPGSYYKGRLSRLGSQFTSGYSKKLSGELDRFKREPPEFQKFKNNVPALYRGMVRKTANEQLGLNSLQFGRLRWGEVREGDDEKGQAHIYTVYKDTGKLDDTGEPLEGEESYQGVVYVFGDFDNPGNTEVAFADFDDTNYMLQLIEEDIVYNTIVTVPGFFSTDQAQAYKKLLSLAKEIPPVERGLDFHSQDIIGRLHKEAANMKHIAECFDKAEINRDDINGWMKSLDLNADGAQEKWVVLAQIIHTDLQAGNHLPWKRAMASFSPNVVKAQVDDEKAHGNKTRADEWWEHIIDIVNKTVAS